MRPIALSTYVLWDSPTAHPLVIGAAIAVVVAVWWLYPPQVRSLRRPWRWLLPAARAAAMLAVTLALLQPVVVRPKTGGEQGDVVVLVDRSESMSVTDTGRAPADLVALAEGLGALPPGKRDRTAAELKAELGQLITLIESVSRARSEVEYATIAGRSAEDAQARLQDDLGRLAADAASLSARAPSLPQSAGLPERFNELTNPPATTDDAGLKEMRARVDRAMLACDALQSQTDAALYAGDPAVKAACDKLAGRSRAALVLSGADSVRSLFAGATVEQFAFSENLAPAAPGAGAAPPTGSTAASDVTGALAAAVERSSDRSLQAVVLFSDGRQVGGSAAGVTLPAGVPLFAMNPVEPIRRDVSIVNIESPTAGFVGETVTLRARVRGAGMKGLPAEVRFESDGVVSSQRITFAAEPEMTVTFPAQLRAGGIRQLEISVAPVEGEITDRNNRATRWIKVFAERTRAAVVTGPDVWAAAALRRVLARDVGFDASFQRLSSPADRVTLPVGAISEQDVVVLSDVGVANLSRAQRIALYRHVTDRGGNLILVAGAEHVSTGYESIPMTAELLPYEASARPTWRVWPGETPALRLVPSRQSLAHPALKLDDDPMRSTARWHSLSGVFRYMPLLDLKPDAVPLLVERASGVAALTEMPLGAGRVFYLGTNETWRWAVNGAAEHDRFWRQLLRYAAREPYVTSGFGLSLDVQPIAAAPGQRVTVRGRLRDEDGTIAQGLELAVLRDGVRIMQVSLLPAGAAEAGRFETTLAGMQAGAYELRLYHPADRSAWIALPLRVEESAEAELANLSGDERALHRLADPTGGGVLSLSELPSLPRRVAAARNRREQVVQYPLWDSPYLFAFVLACFGMEWALRKRFGLA